MVLIAFSLTKKKSLKFNELVMAIAITKTNDNNK